MNLSSSVPDSALQERLSTQAPNTCCSLIYTVSSDFQIRGGIEDNLKIIFLISQRKHTL